MANNVPGYPLKYVGWSIVRELADILTIGQAWMDFAQILDRLSNGAVRLDTIRLLAIREREVNPAMFILSETIRTQGITTGIWQYAFEEMNSVAATVLLRHTHEIAFNMITEERWNQGRPGVENSWNCSSCSGQECTTADTNRSRSNQNPDNRNQEFQEQPELERGIHCTCEGTTGCVGYQYCPSKCDECETRRLQDPDETEVKTVFTENLQMEESRENPNGGHLDHAAAQSTNQDTEQINPELRCTCNRRKNATASGNRENTPLHPNRNGTREVIYSRVKSDPGSRFESYMEQLPTRSSSENVIYKIPADTPSRKRKLKIFVTYADDNNSHLRRVVEMISSLRENPNFMVRSDLDKDTLRRKMLNCHDWVEWQFSTADYVIFCISPRYAEYTDVSRGGGDNNMGAYPDETRLNVRFIFDMARTEFWKNRSTNKRFLPILFPASGTLYEHLPLFLGSTLKYTYRSTFNQLVDFLVARYQEL